MLWLIVIEAMGTHGGIIHVLDYSGQQIKSYRPHSASVIDICFDNTADFIATASVDGKSIHTAVMIQLTYHSQARL